MSDFSQFFGGVSGGAGGSCGSVYSAVKPPAFSSIGNLQNINATAGVTDSFLMPNNRDKLLALNVNPAAYGGADIVSGNWETNTLNWQIDNTSLGSGAAISGFVYNNVTDKYYFACEGSSVSTNNGLFEIDQYTGAYTRINTIVPEFMSASGLSGAGYASFGSHEGSCVYVDSEGNYIWRAGNTYKKFNGTTFAPMQTRSLVAGYGNSNDWYYTDDTTLRVKYVTEYGGAVTASAARVTSSRPLLIIERGNQRRLIDINSIDVFGARWRNDYSPSAVTTLQAYPYAALATHVQSITPMCPVVRKCQFFGDGVRLGLATRNETVVMSDSFLVDRIDYNRWLQDIATAAGMREANETFYGGWVNV